MGDDKLEKLTQRVQELEDSLDRRFYISMLGVIVSLTVGVVVWWNLSGYITLLGARITALHPDSSITKGHGDSHSHDHEDETPKITPESTEEPEE